MASEETEKMISGGDYLNGLRTVREAQKMSQEQLAEAVKVDRTTVTKWETGGSYPRGEMLARLADVLHCTIDELFGRGTGADSA